MKCVPVCHQGQWVTKLGQDIFVNKFGNNYHHIVGPQGLHFDPLSGIVNKHKDIFVVGMPPNWFNRANEIQAHFMNGITCRAITNLAILVMAKFFVFWQSSQDLQKCIVSLYKVGHYYFASIIFCTIMSTKKWPPLTPLWSSLKMVSIYDNCKYCLNMLS